MIELYIRALTTDMNELENQKSKANKEKMQETAQRLSQEFLKLADYVNDSVGLARECVLTAFSLHPTRACYDRIRELAIACGKIKPEAAVEIKTEPPDSEDQQQAESESQQQGTEESNEEKEAMVESVKQEPKVENPADEESMYHSTEKPKVVSGQRYRFS